jgi:hypothetical protein
MLKFHSKTSPLPSPKGELNSTLITINRSPKEQIVLMRFPLWRGIKGEDLY